VDFLKDYPKDHKAGFVNIIGNPNAGKSTLMNALVGEKLAIITAKAQTTRHRILGIVNDEKYQVIFSDTPGILEPKYKLQETMMEEVQLAFRDADVFLILIDLTDKRPFEIPWKKIESSKCPRLLVLNKTDAVSQDDVILEISKWKDDERIEEIFPVSALHGAGVKVLFDRIVDFLPTSPPYYSKEDTTDRPIRFFVSEIIREKIFTNYRQEIPYSVDVYVDSYKEEPNIIRIAAVIITNKKSQKPLLIGKNGSMLKKVGTEARKDIEAFLGKKVFLEMLVKVKENWRDDDLMLKRLG